MGRLLEVVSGFVTAPTGTQTSLGMSAGDSKQIRNAKPGSKILLLAAWADNQTAGVLRIMSTRMHDALQGIRLKITASEVDNLLPTCGIQRMYPGDNLTIDLSGSSTGGDIESAALLMYYEDVEGAAAKLISHDELMKRGINQVSIENTLALGTAGGYSGSEAINAEYDQLKADTEYALAGYAVDTECLLIGWRGIDTGNARVAGPGNEVDRQVTVSWFTDLARRFGMPLIPVFSGSNKGGINIDGVQDENGADPLVNSIFVELAKS